MGGSGQRDSLTASDRGEGVIGVEFRRDWYKRFAPHGFGEATGQTNSLSESIGGREGVGLSEQGWRVRVELVGVWVVWVWKQMPSALDSSRRIPTVPISNLFYGIRVLATTKQNRLLVCHAFSS